jgi:hypothetical protein
MSSIDSEETTKSLQGIRGWLFLPAIVTVTAPAYYILYAVQTIPILNKPPSPDLFYFFLALAVFYVAMALAWGVAIYRMVTLQSGFPPLFILLLVMGLLDRIGEWILVTEVVGRGADVTAFHNLRQISLLVVLWVPYMLFSRRVRATFGWSSSMSF